MKAALVSACAIVAALGCCSGVDPDAASLARAHAPVVAFLGDSITHGLGVGEQDALPAILERRLRAEGLDYRCLNAGVSGNTTTDGLARVDEVLGADPSIVVVELGANDAFRGIDRRRTHANLTEIIERFQAEGIRVVLAGTRFPQLHPALVLAMGRLYEDVARRTGAGLLADLMAGVAGERDLNMADGIHPNREGHLAMADNLWPLLVDEVYRAEAVRSSAQSERNP